MRRSIEEKTLLYVSECELNQIEFVFACLINESRLTSGDHVVGTIK